MISAAWRAAPLFALLVACAVAAEPAGLPGVLVPIPEAGLPATTVAPADGPFEAPVPTAESWQPWGSAAACDGRSYCDSCCMLSERLAVPPFPGRPDGFAVGRITFRTPPHRFWYGDAAIIGLHRSVRRSDLPIAALGGPGDVVLSAEEAYPDFRTGGLARLGWMFAPAWGIEYSYLGTSTWEGDAAVRDQTLNVHGGLGNLFSPFGEFGVDPVTGFDYNDFVSIRGRSRIDSHELSLRQRLPMPPDPLQVSFFYGLRYIHLGERFEYDSQSQIPLPAGAAQSADVRTRNDLFGVQLGTLLELHVDPRWWIDARLAAGLYRNRAEQSTVYQQVGGLPAGNLLESRNEHGTIGAEVSLACAYALSQRLTIRFGYHFLWLDRVALASDNLQTNPVLPQQGPGQLDVSGTIMYHGPLLGATMAW